MSDKPALAAERLDVTLAGRTVLSDVSLSLHQAQLVALVGPNGAGKTTLLRALAGLVPSTGTVEVGGEPPVVAVAARARQTFRLSAARPSGALAAAGQGRRRARALSAWRDRSGAAVGA